jgi:hypothetical protein
MKTLNTVYHVTTKKYYQKIKKQGLIPRIGKLSKEYGEKEKRIYFFITKEEVDNALLNWFGEALEDHYEEEEFVLLAINLNSFDIHQTLDSNGNSFFEQSINFTIPPNLITFISEV